MPSASGAMPLSETSVPVLPAESTAALVLLTAPTSVNCV